MPRRLTYTPKLGAQICTMIAEGVGLKAVCEKLGLNRCTVRGWIDDNRAGFGLAYERARRHRADHFQDEILEISDKIAGCQEPAAVNAARLAVDSRKWLASKLLPERFGDKLTQEISGPGGRDLMPPVETDPQKLAQKLALILMGSINSAKGGRNDPERLARSGGTLLSAEPQPPVTILSPAAEATTRPRAEPSPRLVFSVEDERENHSPAWQRIRDLNR